jgi:hypothetical protein
MANEFSSAGTGAAAGGASGASQGFQYGGPWGALIGGIAGTVGGGASGYLQGRGIKKRQRAQEDAENAMRTAVVMNQGRKTNEAEALINAGGQFSNEYQQAQLQEMGNRAAMARNAEGSFQTAYANAIRDAQGAMNTGASQIPEAQVRGAAQQAYAKNLAAQAQSRALNAQMPGAYMQALQRAGQEQADLGRTTQLKHGQIVQQANQFGNVQSIRNAEIDRDFATAMSAAQAQMDKARKAGSEQMLYGQAINAAMNMGQAGASAYNESRLQSENQRKNDELYQNMMQYYNQPKRRNTAESPYADGTL